MPSMNLMKILSSARKPSNCPWYKAVVAPLTEDGPCEHASRECTARTDVFAVTLCNCTPAASKDHLCMHRANSNSFSEELPAATGKTGGLYFTLCSRLRKRRENAIRKVGWSPAWAELRNPGSVLQSARCLCAPGCQMSVLRGCAR